MTKTFYADSAMGEGFDANPVVSVQAKQLALLTAEMESRELPVRVLDLGCGAGTPTRVLMQDADRFAVVGGDLSPEALRTYARATQRSCTQLDAQVLPFADAAFDVVVSDDVIEHLVDTDAYIREISRVLTAGGWLFLSTPNLAAWFNRIALLVGVQPAFSEVSFEKVFGRPGTEIVGHLRIFTSRSVREFLAHHGFEVVDVQGAAFAAITGVGRWVDEALARFPSIAANTVVAARKRVPGR